MNSKINFIISSVEKNSIFLTIQNATNNRRYDNYMSVTCN